LWPEAVSSGRRNGSADADRNSCRDVTGVAIFRLNT
jgi:hypothetical protein